MFCRQCGRELPEGAKFCTKCGYQITRKEQSVQVPKNNPSKMPVLMLCIVVIIGVAVIGFVALNADKIVKIIPTIIPLADKQAEDETDLVLVNENEISIVAENEETISDKETETMDYETEQMTNNMLDLFEDNLYCVLYMFYFGNHLETTGESGGYNLLKVKTDKFASYSAYEVFLRATYTADVVQTLIVPAKYMSGSNGELCLNAAFVEDGRFYDVSDYYVDWSDYQLVVDSFSEKECYFTVTAMENNPGSGQTLYERSGKAVYQNGKWILTEVVY